MMTNKQNLPEPFVNAIDRDFHISADYSASQLTKPPRMVHLEKRHKHEIVEDVADNIWRLFGSTVHSILQQGEAEDHLVEQYLCEEIAGVKLSGMADLYHNHGIYDYKVTSVWSYIFMADKIPEWESQLNTYAWLFNKAGFPVTWLEIVMILRDWQSSKAKYDQNYPDSQVKTVPIKLWPIEKTEEYLKSRIDLYEKFKETSDNLLPECSPQERWAKPPKYAIMKNGRKSAIKLFDQFDSAESAMVEIRKTKPGEFYIEERKGEMWKRCEYCSVSNFCNQFLDAHQ